MPQLQGIILNNGSAAPKAVPNNLSYIPQWVRVASLSYLTLSAASTTNSVIIFALPAAAIIHGTKRRITTSFTGTSTYTVSIGDGTVPDVYGSAFDVTQAVNTYTTTSSFGGESLTGATSIYATATSTGGNLSAATAGVVDILALLSIAK